MIVDMQNDYCTGTMAIEGALDIVPMINELKRNKMFDHVFTARDWHPSNHVSFQSNHPGTQQFETIKVKETGLDQIMWPKHCVQGSRGAQYVDGLDINDSDIEIFKGRKERIDAISAFGSDQEDTSLLK